ncbi:hypothetical protein [Winogradskya humida]|uniref:hypothetical protein n=1 Tax=Winogradskya humida TaxID=113566 RepID=UPI001943A53E|nr:hypothetical protein [Actinoplanes humidus]
MIGFLAALGVATSGLLAGRNSPAAQYRAALRAHRRALHRLGRSQSRYEQAVGVLQARTAARTRDEQRHRAMVTLHRAQSQELRRYAAYLMATRLQDPADTDELTLPLDPGEWQRRPGHRLRRPRAGAADGNLR